MRKRRDDDDTLPPTPADDRRLRLRREVLRNLQITELNVVVGGRYGANCRTTMPNPP